MCCIEVKSLNLSKQQLQTKYTEFTLIEEKERKLKHSHLNSKSVNVQSGSQEPLVDCWFSIYRLITELCKCFQLKYRRKPKKLVSEIK